MGSEPSPPASHTAMASALPCDPAIGAWMIGSATPSRWRNASSDVVVDAPELTRVAPDDDFGGAHRHLAGETHDTRDAARLHPARRARMTSIFERAKHRAHVILDADVLRELDLDVA